MIIFLSIKNAFDDDDHPFMINALKKIEKDGTCFNTIKAVYESLLPKLYELGEN